MTKKSLAIVFFLGISLCLFAMTNKPAKTNEKSSGQAAPKTVFHQFNLRGLDGQEKHNLGELIAGNVAVINIWATWCPPCRAEIPDLIEVYNQYKNKNVIVVGVSVDKDGTNVVKGFVRENNVTYPILLDDGSVSREFGVRGIPTTLFVNEEGKVVAKKVGYADKKYFSAQIDKLLQ